METALLQQTQQMKGDKFFPQGPVLPWSVGQDDTIARSEANEFLLIEARSTLC